MISEAAYKNLLKNLDAMTLCEVDRALEVAELNVAALHKVYPLAVRTKVQQGIINAAYSVESVLSCHRHNILG